MCVCVGGGGGGGAQNKPILKSLQFCFLEKTNSLTGPLHVFLFRGGGGGGGGGSTARLWGRELTLL